MSKSYISSPLWRLNCIVGQRYLLDSSSVSRVKLMYNDDCYVKTTFFAEWSNLMAIAEKKYLHLSTCTRETAA
jgi:hypothetical protein